MRQASLQTDRTGLRAWRIKDSGQLFAPAGSQRDHASGRRQDRGWTSPTADLRPRRRRGY